MKLNQNFFWDKFLLIWGIIGMLFPVVVVMRFEGKRKKVAERIFIAPPIWILCRCNHSLLYKSCIAVHQVDDVGMVLGVLVL